MVLTLFLIAKRAAPNGLHRAVFCREKTEALRIVKKFRPEALRNGGYNDGHQELSPRLAAPAGKRPEIKHAERKYER